MAKRYQSGIREYWVTGTSREIISKLQQYHGTWSIWGTNPAIQAWVRNTIAYYSHILDPAAWESSLVYEGEQGELVRMVVPQARSLIRNFVSLVTKQKLSMRAVVMNRGTSDIKNVLRLGNSVAANVIEDQNLDIKGERLVEKALIQGHSFLKTTWESELGLPFAIDDGDAIVAQGDVKISVIDVFDTFYDYSIEDFDDLDWVEARTQRNRWTLIAKYPDLKDKILQLPSVIDWMGTHDTEYQSISEDDLVYVYEFYHKPTFAVPNGRMVIYGSDDTVFYDGENPYGEIPIHQMKPAPIDGMGMGAALFSELLPCQEMLDHSMSAIASNQVSFAVQNVMVPRGANISAQEITGLNFIHFTPMPGVPNGGAPAPLQLTKSPPEVFQFLDLCNSYLQQLSNINPAMKGAPPPGVTSGTAIATLTTNSLEFMSPVAKAYQTAMEKAMMSAINAYRRFATTERVVFMSGRSEQTLAKEFVGADLDPIKGIEMQIANPLMQTVAGRVDVAEKLIAAGLITNVQQYLSVTEGDSLTKLEEPELNENDLVESENEALTEGRQVRTLSTDDHAMHLRMHGGLLNDALVRFDDEKVSLILEHMMEHYRLAQETDPMLTAMVRTGKMPEMAQPGDGGGSPALPPEGEAAIPPDAISGTPAPPGEGGALPQDMGGTPADVALPTTDLLGRV